MQYVALSRVRNSSTSHILNLNEKRISGEVQQEMSRMRKQPLVSRVPCLYNNDQPSIIFKNLVSKC